MATSQFYRVARKFCTSAAARGKLVQAPIQLFGVEGRYAHALYSAATKEKKLDLVEKEIKGVQDLLAKDVKLAEYIANPTIKKQEKTKSLKMVMEILKYSDITSNFFGAMSDNGRLAKASAIINAFGVLMSAHRGEVICSVTTAKALDAGALKELRTALQGFMKKGETLQLELKVDPSLIGGMVVTIGDKYVDMSMASKIKAYTNLIKQAV